MGSACHSLALAPTTSLLPTQCPQILILLHPALVLLWESYRLAQDISPKDPAQHMADFGLPRRLLLEVGLNERQLNWLSLKGYVQNLGPPISCALAETDDQPSPGDAPPRGRDDDLLALSRKGVELVQRLTDAFLEPCDRTDVDSTEAPERNGAARESAPSPVPRWHRELRELWVENVLVKQFKNPAENQELILSAFEEEHWPPRIDDPLPPHPEQDARLRLRDTISSLNRHQQTQRLRFHGDGTGRGVRWELIR